MGFDVSLHKVPKGKRIDEDVLFYIAHEAYIEDNDENFLLDTNFSKGNPNAADFARVFDLFLTNNDFFKIFNEHDYNRAKNRLQTMSLNDSLLERVNDFLEIVDRELKKGETIFFYCS